MAGKIDIDALIKIVSQGGKITTGIDVYNSKGTLLLNGQMAYVLESNGPLIIPFTDTKGDCLSQKPDPLDLSDAKIEDSLKIDNRKSIKKPCEVYDLLPSYLKSGSESKKVQVI
ncbi:MAG: hypothetical protein KKE44_03360 [Proteobacteria bacterium]|nr:hypothetical protein [Pseudomonadota bacterium]MBU1581766.1 hypothetical protein [Pseudomonadota bacterium]MBU2455548.1 hypothetical protein [Pseudomonadota bacterium]MBU2629129.1 hypothetical protein [Pseudomonadota bacterium]